MRSHCSCALILTIGIAGCSTRIVAFNSPGCADSGPGGDGTDTNQVTATVIDTFDNEGPDGELVQTMSPRDLRGATVAATYEDDSGGFVTKSGSGSSTGTFLVPDVPLVEYDVRLDNRYVRTIDRHPALGVERPGRANGVPVTLPSPIVYDVTALEPLTQDDILELHCFHDGSFDLRGLSSFDANAPKPGDTALVGARADWLATAGNQLIDSDQGDVAFLLRTSTRSAGGLGYQTLSGLLRLDHLKQIDGQPLTISGAMSPVAQTDIMLDFRASEFQALTPSVHPRAVTSLPRISISTSPGNMHPAIPASGPSLADFAPPSPNDVVVAMTYGNPFPPGWGVAVLASFLAKVDYALPGGAAVSLSAMIRSVQSLDSLGTSPLRPLLGPVADPRIDGMDAFSDVTVADPTATLSWSPPLIGVARSYSVNLVELVASNGNLGSAINVATIEVGDATSVRVVPGILAPGHHYVARIKASTDSSSSASVAFALTGIIAVAN